MRIYESADGHVAVARLREAWSLGPVTVGMHGRARATAAKVAEEPGWLAWLPSAKPIPSTTGWELIGIYDDQADVPNVLTDSETGEAGRLYLLGMGLDLAARDERDWADDLPSDITSEQEQSCPCSSMCPSPSR